MNLFVFISFYISLWISCSSSIFKFFEKIFQDHSITKKQIFLSLSLGFIFSFSSLASFNLLFHLFGITFSNNNFLIPTTIALVLLNTGRIKEFFFAGYSDLQKISKNFTRSVDPLISIILLIIIIQIFCLFIRFLLPVSHGDALSQYFYDALQISRLENLSISEYYKIGAYLKTDSLASFFDALIIQLTDNWILVRGVRFLALILILLSSLEMAANIGSISLKRGILLIAVILTLPDVWDISLSGKHDVYVFLFELIGIYNVSLSILAKDKFIKIIYLAFSIFVGLMSVGIRLSSLYFLILSIILFVYNLFLLPINLYFNNFLKFLSSIRISIFLLIGIIVMNFAICYFNLKYFSNPFYWISPPDSLKSIFPNAIYVFDYGNLKKLLELRNVPIFIKPIITFFYSTFGIEPIRYVFNKFKDFNGLILIISNYLNFIGPKSMMVSIHSFSPFVVLPFLGIKNFKNKRKISILIFITIWILIWSISIPYTRVALASSISLIILGFSQSISFKFDFQKYKYFDIFKSFIISCGFLYTILFSFWSLSYLPDLPLKSLINDQVYSRTNLTREYIKLQNKILNKNPDINLVPSKKFEMDWKDIEQTYAKKRLFLKGAPKRYGYFMKKGLITPEKIKVTKELESNTICFGIDQNQMISKRAC